MRRRLVSVVVLVLCVGLAPPALSDTRTDEAPVISFSDMEPVEGARAELERRDDGIGLKIETARLQPGHAYSVWWVVFDHPEACVHPTDWGRCSGADATAEGDPARSTMLHATGRVVGKGTDRATFNAQIESGKPAKGEVVFGDGVLENPLGAEVHVLIRSHGEMVPGSQKEQTSTLDGVCNPACENVQFAVFGEAPDPDPDPDPGAHLRLNHVQARGTHNSYHRNPMWPQPTDWHYSHRPLEAQFEHQDVRQIELDIHYSWARDDFEVYHVGIDARSTCKLFTECLDQVKRWSDARPNHHPILILVEPKDGGPPRDSGLPEDASPLTHPIREPEYDKVDDIIRNHPIFERTLTPDDVTVPGLTLRESILTAGWPRLSAVRGHVLFLVDGGEHGRDYSSNWTSLADRTMFVQDNGTRATSAFVTRGGGISRMAPLIRQGFMIRDLTGPSGFNTSKAAGVQFISTDYPEQLVLSDDPAAPSRCNPVSTEGLVCEDAWLETRTTDPYPHEIPPDPEDSLAQSFLDHADFMVVNSAGSLASCALRACTPPVDRMLDR